MCFRHFLWPPKKSDQHVWQVEGRTFHSAHFDFVAFVGGGEPSRRVLCTGTWGWL